MATDTPAVAYQVMCGRCDHVWAENDDGVRYLPVMEGSWDWFCADETECDDRMFEQRQAKGHPDGF